MPKKSKGNEKIGRRAQYRTQFFVCVHVNKITNLWYSYFRFREHCVTEKIEGDPERLDFHSGV